MKNISKEEFYKNHDSEVQKKLATKTVGIVGAGGIGSNVALSLARSGVGKLIIADFDTVQITNLNRQFYFIHQIGKKKVEALKTNLQSVNPFIEYELYDKKIGKDNLHIFNKVNLLIEAVDNAEIKIEILSNWEVQFPKIPIILASGIAGIGDNNSIQCKRIDDYTYICGDFKTSIKDFPPYAPKVCIVANLMANLALEILLKS